MSFFFLVLHLREKNGGKSHHLTNTPTTDDRPRRARHAPHATRDAEIETAGTLQNHNQSIIFHPLPSSLAIHEAIDHCTIPTTSTLAQVKC
jgi:hypothetical protein